jgi:hypothetical protein
MARFWFWLLPSVAVFVALYAGASLLADISIPRRADTFDTQLATTSELGWVNEQRYFMLNKSVLSRPANRVIILGASTARDPLRPQIMERNLPGWQVINASLSGAAISEIADQVDLIQQELSNRGGKNVFVLCLTYLQFRPVERPQGTDNPLGAEATRTGLFERRKGKLTPLFSPGAERSVMNLWRPHAVAASLPRRVFRSVFANPRLPWIKNNIDQFRGADPLARWTERIGETEDLNTLNVPADIQSALMAQRLSESDGDKPLPDTEFDRLESLIEQIRSQGDDVVIVDLPLPKWHRVGAIRMDTSYLERLASDPKVLSTSTGYNWISLREFDEDQNFFDSGHTKPKLWPLISDKVSLALAPIARRNP